MQKCIIPGKFHMYYSWNIPGIFPMACLLRPWGTTPRGLATIAGIFLEYSMSASCILNVLDPVGGCIYMEYDLHLLGIWWEYSRNIHGILFDTSRTPFYSLLSLKTHMHMNTLHFCSFSFMVGISAGKNALPYFWTH